MGYNCGIMLRRMAILAIATSMAVSVSGQPDKTSDQNQQPAKQGQPAVVTANSPNERSNGQTHQPQGSPDSPKWYAALERPDWWVVGFAFLTACVICWQSWETRKAARGAERAADATLAQTQLIRDKERARLTIEPARLEVVTDPESKREWNLRATIKVQNIGATKAFDINGCASLWVQDSSSPITPGLLLPWFDPPGFRISADPGGYVVQIDSQIPALTLNQFVDGMTHSEKGKFPSKKAVYLQGFVEYETLGVRFCRDYGWHWLTGHWEEEDCRVYIGDRLIAGKWYEDDKQKNSERAKPN